MKTGIRIAIFVIISISAFLIINAIIKWSAGQVELNGIVTEIKIINASRNSATMYINEKDSFNLDCHYSALKNIKVGDSVLVRGNIISVFKGHKNAENHYYICL